MTDAHLIAAREWLVPRCADESEAQWLTACEMIDDSVKSLADEFARWERKGFAAGQAERVASIMHNPDIDGNSLAAMLRREGFEMGERKGLERAAAEALKPPPPGRLTCCGWSSGTVEEVSERIRALAQPPSTDKQEGKP